MKRAATRSTPFMLLRKSVFSAFRVSSLFTQPLPFALVEDLLPEIAAQVRQEHSDHLSTISDLIRTEAFSREVREPLLEGSFTSKGSSATSRALEAWCKHRLDRSYGGRFGLLANILRSTATRSALSKDPLPWSIGSLVRALQMQSVLFDNTKHYKSLAEHFKAIAFGIENIACVGSTCVPRQGDFWDIPADFEVHLYPRPDLLVDAFIRIQFGIVSSASDPLYELILDYRSGNSASLPLIPMGRARFQAFAATHNLLRLRWRIASNQCSRPTELTAMPVSKDQLTADLHTTAGMFVAGRFAAYAELLGDDDPPSGLAPQLSRMATRHLGAHIEPARTYALWLQRNESGKYITKKTEMAAAQNCTPLIHIIIVDESGSLSSIEASLTSFGSSRNGAWKAYVITSLEDSDVSGQQFWIRNGDGVVLFASRRGQNHCRVLNEILDGLDCGWLIRLSAGDQFAPEALHHISTVIRSKPHVSIIYADEDEIGSDGNRQNPILKPGFSPDYLRAFDYMSAFTLYDVTLLKAVGGWRASKHPAESYDLLLRCIDHASAAAILHIDEILLHRCQLSATDADPMRAAREWEAVDEHLKRIDFSASVEVMANRIRRIVPNFSQPKPKVSIIIPTRDEAALLERCVRSILDKSTYTDLEVIIVDNLSTELVSEKTFAKLSSDNRVKIERYPFAFNYSKINNFAAEKASGAILGMVNNDVEVISSNWLEELVRWAAVPEVGCVGAKLYFYDNRVQHAGVILGVGGVAGHGHKFSRRGEDGYGRRLMAQHNVSAVTGACLFLKRSLFQTVGGLDEDLAIAFNDVDLCLRVQNLGYRTIFNPYAELYHLESATRGIEDTAEKLERFFAESALMRRRWGDRIITDPYYSKHLSLVSEDFSVRWRDDEL